jgi:hypothetical protein
LQRLVSVVQKLAISSQYSFIAGSDASFRIGQPVGAKSGN